MYAEIMENHPSLFFSFYHQPKQPHQERYFPQIFTLHLLQEQANVNFNLIIDFNQYRYYLLSYVKFQLILIKIITSISHSFFSFVVSNQKIQKHYHQELYMCSLSFTIILQFYYQPSIIPRLIYQTYLLLLRHISIALFFYSILRKMLFMTNTRKDILSRI